MPWELAESKKKAKYERHEWINKDGREGGLQGINVSVYKDINDRYRPDRYICLYFNFGHAYNDSVLERKIDSASTNCYCRILHKFGKKSAAVGELGEGFYSSPEFIFDPRTELDLFKSILHFVSQEICHIDDVELQKMLAVPCVYYGLGYGSENADDLRLKRDCSAYLKEASPESAQIDRLDTILSAIESLDRERFGQIPLFMSLAAMLEDAGHLQAAMYVLRERDHWLMPRGHAMLARLLWQSSAFSTLAEAEDQLQLSRCIEIMEHALQGLMGVKEDYASTDYRKEAETVIEKVMRFLGGSNPEAAAHLRVAMEGCFAQFRKKTFTHDIPVHPQRFMDSQPVLPVTEAAKMLTAMAVSPAVLQKIEARQKREGINASHATFFHHGNKSAAQETGMTLSSVNQPL